MKSLSQCLQDGDLRSKPSEQSAPGLDGPGRKRLPPTTGRRVQSSADAKLGSYCRHRRDREQLVWTVLLDSQAEHGPWSFFRMADLATSRGSATIADGSHLNIAGANTQPASHEVASVPVRGSMQVYLQYPLSVQSSDTVIAYCSPCGPSAHVASSGSARQSLSSSPFSRHIVRSWTPGKSQSG